MAPEPLLVIVGPTASGKSRMGVEAAERLGGEVVSADAFAVYRGLDIGTDKPDAATRARVRHHLVDIADPATRFSAGDFITSADAAIADIRGRGLIPTVVGGTHFYVRALLVGLFPSPPHDPTLRLRLEQEWQHDPGAARDRLRRVDPAAADRIAAGDRQRILRALEVHDLTGRPLSELWLEHRRHPRYQPLLVAPLRSRADLYARINARVDVMFASGLVAEVERLLAAGVSHDAHALKAIGYRQVVSLLEGDCDIATAMEDTRTASRQLAKRQLSWLRTQEEGRLHWLQPVEEGGVEQLLTFWEEQRKVAS
jgi:tRNA dimethylallyltransferase